jgi:hypothetical protein
LSSLYIKQLQSSSSTTLKAETVQRALQMSESRFAESTSQYGYSHESSLTQLRELSTVYSRQQKTELAVKHLSTAVSEISKTEKSSQTQIEAAASLAYTFRSIDQISTAQSLVQELHRQICAKDTRYASKWSFDLTKSNRTALAFLAALQYNIRKDLNVTFAEIMADLAMEYIYFEQFHHTLANNESLTNILLAAAPLRWFLRRNSRQEMIKVVEDQAVDLFVKRDAQDLNTLSKESPRIFIIGILDHLGNGRNKNFNRSVILASNDSVTKLTQAKKFPEAYDIAHLGYLYASKNDGYNGPRAISMGFKLASLLVGREGEKCQDAALRKKMLELSNRIVKRILEICKNLNINFAQVQLFELSQLSVLLGEQEDYETLEVSHQPPVIRPLLIPLFVVAPYHPLEHPRRSTYMACRGPPQSWPPLNLRTLPRTPTCQSHPSRRRHCLQHAPRSRSPRARHYRGIRATRSALHIDGPDIQQRSEDRRPCARELQESPRCARRHPSLDGQRNRSRR